jgi:hypothetical protein
MVMTLTQPSQPGDDSEHGVEIKKPYILVVNYNGQPNPKTIRALDTDKEIRWTTPSNLHLYEQEPVDSIIVDSTGDMDFGPFKAKGIAATRPIWSNDGRIRNWEYL